MAGEHHVVSAAEGRKMWEASLTEKSGRGRAPGEPRYGIRPYKEGGETYRSHLEEDVHKDLVLFQSQGLITRIEREVNFPVVERDEYGPAIQYRADFVLYFPLPPNSQGFMVLETKGAATAKKEAWKIKRRLYLQKYGAEGFYVCFSREDAARAVQEHIARVRADWEGTPRARR